MSSSSSSSDSRSARRATFARLSLAAPLLFLLAACSGSGPREAASAARPAGANTGEFRLRDSRLRSGLRVLVEEDRTAPVVGVVNVVGTGSTDDPPGKEGLAHLVEHLTFRARQSPRASMGALLAQAGGADVNATTDFDATVYHEHGPRDALGDLLTLEGLRIVDPLANLDEATFAIEREVVRNELRLRGETVAGGAAIAALQQATFPATHPYARPVVGTHESLSSITLEDARAFVRAHYRPSNMTVVINGDVDLAGIGKLLASTWSPSLDEAPAAGAPQVSPRLSTVATPPPDPPAAAGLSAIEAQVAAPELYVAWSLPRGYGDAEHLGVLAVAGVRAAIHGAAARDQDVVGGTAFVIPGEQASLLVGHVYLREGAHPEASADRVLGNLIRAWD